MKYNIETILEMYEDDYVPSSTVQGPRNMDENIQLAATGTPSSDQAEFSKAWKEYNKSYRFSGPNAVKNRLSPSQFFQIWTRENIADGGRAGYNDGQLVTPNVDGSRPGYRGEKVRPLSHPTWDFKIPKGRITANQLAEELGIAKSTLKKYRTKGVTVDKYPLKGFIDETFKPIRGQGNYTYYLKPTEKMLENYQNFKNRTTISRDLLNDVEKLHKSKLFKDLVKSKNKTLPTLEQVVEVLGKETKAHHRAANAVSVLSKMYQGDEYRLLKLPKNEETGKFIFKALRKGGKNNPYKAAYYNLAIEEIDKTLGNETGTLKNFKRYFKDNLTKYLGKGHGVTLNEVASISGMVSNDMAPYGAFVDLTNTKINNNLLANFQGDLSKALTKIDGLKGTKKLLAIKQFNTETLPKFKQNIADKYGNKLAEKIRFTEIVPGKKLTDTYKAEDLATWKKQGIDLQSLAKQKDYYLDVKGARPYTEFLDNKKLTKTGKINAMETLIKSLCPKGKAAASGGRIGFNTAGAVTGTVACGQKQLQKLLFKGGGTTGERNLVQKIISGGGKMAMSMLNPKELLKLKNIVGPGALGLMAAYEAGSITDDVLRLNKPLDEALAGNWLTKSFLPYSEEFAKQKNLLQSGKLTGPQREYALEMMKMEEFIKEGKRIQDLEANKLVEGTLGDDFAFTSDEELNKAYDGLFGRLMRLQPYMYEEGITGRSLENEAAMNEYIDAQTARTGASKIFGGPQRMVNKAPRPKNMGRGPMTSKGEMKLDFSIPGYTPYDQAYTPSDEEILQIYRSQGIVPPTSGYLAPGEGTRVRMGLASQGDNRSIYGSKFSEGGITTLRSKYEYKK